MVVKNIRVLCKDLNSEIIALRINSIRIFQMVLNILVVVFFVRLLSKMF